MQAAAAVVEANGLVVLEHARRCAVPVTSGALASIRTLVSGDSALTFYEPHASSEKQPAAHER